MRNLSMLGMPTYVKSLVFLSTLITPMAALASSAQNGNAFDRMGKSAVGETEWAKVKAGGSGNAAGDIESGIEKFIDVSTLVAIAVGFTFVAWGVASIVMKSKNCEPFVSGVIFFFGGLVLMVIGVLAWAFAAQIKSWFL